MLKKIVKMVLIVVVGVLVIGVIHGQLLTPERQYLGEIVAYRAGGSAVNYSKLQQTGCTARSLTKSGINSVENTLQAASGSVAAGADVIHLNVHRTRDNELVVFHDWKLDCATNGVGPIHKASFKELQHLDAGHGYSFDNGKTFPFRDKGYRISKLATFYQQYPTHTFWLNLKNNDPQSFNVLYEYIADKKNNHTVITSDKGSAWFKQKDPSIKLASVDSVKSCGIDYLLMGWSGFVPESCRNTVLFIPPNMSQYFWGYPERLAARLQSHGSAVYLWSKHEPLDLSYADHLASGIGVITSDLAFIEQAHATKLATLNGG